GSARTRSLRRRARSRREPRPGSGGRGLSRPVTNPVGALQLTEECGPFLAGLDETAEAVHLESLIDGLGLSTLRERLKLAPARQGIDLDAARRLDAIHPHEGLAHRLADRHQTVVLQDQNSLRTEILHDARPLAAVERRPLDV